MHRSVRRSSFLALILAPSAGVFLLSTPAAADSVEVTETLRTFDAANDFDPALSGSDTVFTSTRTGTADVLLVDEFFNISFVDAGPGDQLTPDIDGALVVNVDMSLGNANLILTDLVSGSQRLLTFDAANETAPAISGTTVVFVTTSLGGDDIFRVDAVTFNVTPVATGSGAEIAPAIDGNLIAWQVFESGSINVYGKQIGGATFPIATGPGQESGASVSGNLVAYIVDGDVAVYNHGTGQTTQITNDAFNQSRVVIDGQNLVWQDNSNGNEDLFLHNLALGQSFQLTSDPSDQTLGDFEGNRVVFHDRRLGNFQVWQVEFTIIPDVPSLSFPGVALLAGLLVGIGSWLLRRQRVPPT